jgi:hypothetical protein
MMNKRTDARTRDTCEPDCAVATSAAAANFPNPHLTFVKGVSAKPGRNFAERETADLHNHKPPVHAPSALLVVWRIWSGVSGSIPLPRHLFPQKFRKHPQN